MFVLIMGFCLAVSLLFFMLSLRKSVYYDASIESKSYIEVVVPLCELVEEEVNNPNLGCIQKLKDIKSKAVVIKGEVEAPMINMASSNVVALPTARG